MEASELVRSIRMRGGLSQADLAKMAGVASSTVSRIERGQLDPTWSVMNRLLESAGYLASGVLTSRGDVAAVAAARRALGETVAFPAGDRVLGWIDRWKRARFVDEDGRARDVEKVGVQAGVAARVFDRPNPKVSVVYDRSWQDIAVALRSSGVRYAVSGITATSPTRVRDGAAWPMIYVDSITEAMSSAGLRKQTTSAPRVTLLGFDDVAATGTVDEAGFTFVSPAQALIDSYAGPGRMADLADAAASRWKSTAAE